MLGSAGNQKVTGLGKQKLGRIITPTHTLSLYKASYCRVGEWGVGGGVGDWGVGVGWSWGGGVGE